MPKKVHGIFAGGGANGAAFVGAVEEAAKYVEFVGWGGTSAGSIVAALLACGFTPEELRAQLIANPYAQFFQVNPWRLLRFGHYRGVADPEPLLAWIRGLIHKKFPNEDRVTFRRFWELTKKPLKIVATNLSTQDIEPFSVEDTPNEEVAQAALASCAYPVLFPPQRHGHVDLVDGGVLSNFPMWLFHNGKETVGERPSSLGFTLVSKRNRDDNGVVAHFTSVFDAIVAAQDRVQERYLDAAHLSNVIRIDVSGKPTFPGTQSREQQESLLLAGKDAALAYFGRVTRNFGEPVKVFSIGSCVTMAKNQLDSGDVIRAVSTIARNYLLHGGVARDDGPSDERVIVSYYVNLMEAVTEHGNLEILASVLASAIRDLPEQPARVIGLKKGNAILAYEVARQLGLPLALFKTDMSYKLGAPFDGKLKPGEPVVLVDDFASDASMLINAIDNLHWAAARTVRVVVLMERKEGDARDRIQKRGFALRAICRANDDDIRALIDEDTPLPTGRKPND